MELTIYRSDFRQHLDNPDESMFEGILDQLRIDRSKWDKIEEVTVRVDSFELDD